MRPTKFALLLLTCLLWTHTSRAQPCPRVDVTTFKTSGSVSWQTAFQNAIASLSPCGGGGVYVPPGSYPISGLSVPSNITFTGDGATSKIIGSIDQAIFLVTDATDVTFQGLHLQLNGNSDSEVGIRIEGGKRHRVEGCLFTSDPSPATNFNTMAAVYAENAPGLMLANNHIEALQFKLSAAVGGPDTIVTGNRWSNARNFAVSYVSRSLSNGPKRLVLQNNVVSSVDSGANGVFYVGTDGDTYSSNNLEDIIIQSNVISSSSTNAIHAPILVRAATNTKRVIIADNIISVTNSGPYSCITLKDYDGQSGDPSTAITVRGNQVDGCQYGLWMTMAADSFNIGDNTFRANAGIWLQPIRTPGLQNGALHDNIISGGRITLSASTSTSGVRFSNNNVKCGSTSSPAIVLQAAISGITIDADLATNTVRNCSSDYAEWGSGTFTGRRN